MLTIAIKMDEFEKRKRSSSLLHLAMGLFLLIKTAEFYKAIQYKNFLTITPLLIVASFSLFYGLFRKKLDASGSFNFWLRCLQLLAFATLGLLLLGKGTNFEIIVSFAFSLFCLLLLFNERKIFEDTFINFEQQGITIPSYYTKHLVKWNELSEVVVRQDFVTLFHVNKKYLQYQVMQDLSTLEVAKMNAFCKEMIESTEDNRKSSINS